MASHLVAASRATAARVAAAMLLGCVALVGCEDCNKGGASAPAADSGESSASPEGGPIQGGATAVSSLDGGAMNATPLPTASVAAMVNPDKLRAYDGPTGIVEGTVTVTGDPARATPNDFSRCPDAESMWGHAFREGPPVSGAENGSRPLADAIVVVTGYKGFYLPEKNEAKEVRIERCVTNTRTATLTFGQRIEVKNLSNEFWTPLLEPGPNLVMMMATPNGDPAKIYPKKPGHFLLLDRDRKYAVVDVYSFLHPLHAATTITGYYRIEGVPVGKLKVSSMHPQIAESTAEQEITVAPGVVHKVDLVLKNVNRDAGPPATRHASADAGPAPLLK